MLKPDRFSCSQKIWLKQDPPILWQSTPAEAMSGIWEDKCRLWQDWTLQEGMPQQNREGGK